MAGFGFMNLGQAAQGQPPLGQQQPMMQQQPQTMGTLPQGQTATQDPRSVYLQQALASLGGGQNAPKNGMALGSDMLAEALDRYALGKQQRATNMAGISTQQGGAQQQDPNGLNVQQGGGMSQW